MQNFGYKIGWMAVKCNNLNELRSNLQLTDLSEISWNEGIVAAYKGSLFISPVINQWIFLVGDVDTVLENFYQDCTKPEEEQYEQYPFLYCSMIQMSMIFQEVQYYYSHRVSGTYVYAKAIQGIVIRSYFIDSCSGNYHEIGSPSPEEILNGLTFSLEKYNQNAGYLGEDIPSYMSGIWSLNPHKFEEEQWDWLANKNGLIYG